MKIDINAFIDLSTKAGVGVSGGQDSLCLLHLLVSTITKRGGDPSKHLRVIHCDHQWRDDSERNAQHVEGICLDMGIPCTTYTWTNNTKKGEGLARQWRLSCFDNACNEFSLAKVYLGHTRSDRVETILHKLVRGTSPQGMVGIRDVAFLDKLTLVRPLLNTLSRSDTLNYCQENDLQVWEDSTNLDTKYVRNRIRLGVLPILSSVNTAMEEHVLSLSNMIEEDSTYLDELALLELSKAVQSWSPTTMVVPKVSRPILRRVIFYWLEMNINRSPSYKEVMDVLEVVDKRKLKSNNLKGGYSVVVPCPRREVGHLLIIGKHPVYR